MSRSNYDRSFYVDVDRVNWRRVAFIAANIAVAFLCVCAIRKYAATESRVQSPPVERHTLYFDRYEDVDGKPQLVHRRRVVVTRRKR